MRPRWAYVYLLGFIVGLTVQFTSVGGAGVVVSFTLMNVARLDPKDVVGGVTILYGLALSAMGFLNYAASAGGLITASPER